MNDLRIGLLIDLFLVLGALFALWKGGKAERVAALVVLANVVIGHAGKALIPDSQDLVRLVNDGLAALALLLVTIRFAAPWMGGVMLFFAAQFAMHSYYLVTDRPHDFFHALINNINWSGVAWCLVIGTAFAWRARARAQQLALQAAP
jgi:hypothetical protein